MPRPHNELVHAYSLVHDLPAMDNVSLRRGKPRCVASGNAILAGDALLTGLRY